MAKFIIGDAIPNARGYRLLKATNTSTITKMSFTNAGYIQSNGTIAPENIRGGKAYTDIIPISKLADGDGGFCVQDFDTYDNYPKVIFFSGNTLDTFIKGVTRPEFGDKDKLTVAEIVALAPIGATHVAFNSDYEEEVVEDFVYVYSQNKFSYQEIATKPVGKDDTANEGYLKTDGTMSLIPYENLHVTPIIDIEDLADGVVHNGAVDLVGCAYLTKFDTNTLDYMSASFYSERSLESVVWAVRHSEISPIGSLVKLEDIKSIADAHGAKYVSFCGKGTVYTYRTEEIRFDLDFYKEYLPEGEVHLLVVQAIGEGGEDLNGDGKIYEDSDYCLDASGNPLVYMV